MHKMLRGAAWMSTLLLFFALRCAAPTSTGGSSSETVIGRVVNRDGSPACSTVVTLYPAGYDPVRDVALVRLSSDTTDVTGAYRLKVLDSTAGYSIVAAKQKSGTNTLITGIVVTGDTTRAPVAVLAVPGAIIAAVPDSADALSGYIYIPGTGIAASFSGCRIALLANVPAGTIASVDYASRSSSAAASVLATGIEVTSRDTTIAQWRYAARLHLNTTSSGAGVSGNVMNFPVLVRLTASNFNFGQAKTDGSDIRFTTSNGVPLSYEIERWNAGTQQAEIWVRVDTVYGNDSAQSLTMQWGNGNAAAQSNGPAVFDTAAGFQGVWHLGETGGGAAKDATANHYDGTPSDTAPGSVAGTIGRCRSFNGSSNFIRMNGTAAGKLNFPENGIYTMSAWAYADSLDDGFHLVAGKGNEQYYLKLKQSVPTTTMRWEFVEYHDKAGWLITNGSPTARAWTYIVGIRKGTAQYFYMNGTLVDSTISVTSSPASRNTGNDASIGKFLSMPADSMEGLCAFLGMIDEVRISNVAYDGDWIKLCYMNQKAQDALVKW